MPEGCGIFANLIKNSNKTKYVPATLVFDRDIVAGELSCRLHRAACFALI